MKTPWGEIAVSDSHVHLFSHQFFSSLAKQKGIAVRDSISALSFEIPPEDPAALAARWVQELDNHGLASSALIASVPGDEASVAAE